MNPDTDGNTPDGAEPEADDAFSALGNATRLRALQTLASADEPPTFTELFEAIDEDTTAGFAYHLRQLADRYVRKEPESERYHLTYAGRQAARALSSGSYTERVNREPESVDGDCPVCDGSGLEARVADNFVVVACTDCQTELLSLPFPPSGARDRDTNETLAAFDSFHRSRVRLLTDGVCPDCAGRASAKIVFVNAPNLPGDATRPTLVGSCADCDFRMRAPVSLAVVEHPGIVAFFRENGKSVRDRPLWNLGSEWSETVLSEDPAAVRVTVRLEGEELRMLVGDGPTVVDSERVTERAKDAEDVEATDDGVTENDYDATAAGSS